MKNRDYAPNELLDRYSDRDIDDEGDFEEMSAAARRAAEIRMNRRDRLERAGKQGTRAANRGRAPQFLEDDDMDDEDALGDDLGVGRMKRRTRRQYDERRDVDDVDGVDDVGENPCGQSDVYSSIFIIGNTP
jgi:DNA replication licensing factor MCM2